MRKATKPPFAGMKSARLTLSLAPLLAIFFLGCDGELGENASEDQEGTSPMGGDGDDGDGDGGPDINDDAWSSDPDIDPFLPLARRLTRDELRHTLSDTLGIEFTDDEFAPIPVDRPLEGFVNVATSQTVLPDHVEGYASLSEAVSDRLDWGSLVSNWGGCTDATDACTAVLVNELGSTLFRRPVTSEEQTAFASLATLVLAEEGADFFTAADAVLRAMMQSPQFLYRLEDETAAATGLEPGGTKTVTGYEMASRLSYLVWGSGPDEELLNAAADGRLESADDAVTELNRMLTDPDRARRVTDRYMMDWGRLEALPDDGGLKQELIDSVVASYSYLLWDQQVSPTDVFTADEILLTPTLATNLGLEPGADGLQPYSITEQSGRAGLLTHPGLVAGMTNADGGAIVARGLFLQTQLFCQETPSPPVAFQEEIDAFVEELPENASDRMIAETRLERPECGNCHSGFDPLAYGLEQFDYQGRFRNEDEYGNALSTTGWIPAQVRLEGADLSYSTVDELAELLQSEPAVHHCLTEQHLKYALGRTFAPELEPLVSSVYERFQEQGGTYSAMMEAIVRSDLFRKMKVE